MRTWNDVVREYPKFAAMVDILVHSHFWHEECPSETSWWFRTKDNRYFARVHWYTHTVSINRVRV